MRDLLDRYVRSLKEREDDPERDQDLGTLVCWILEQRGYIIVERAYKHRGAVRLVSKGRLQLGVDILAYKETDAGYKSYRFVLKQGGIGKTEWTPTVPGSMPHDLSLTAGDPPNDREERYGLAPYKIVTVAVHNGDRDDAAIGHLIQSFLRQLRSPLRQGPAKPLLRRATMWWDAAALVRKILDTTPAGDGSSFAQHPDASIVPPLVRPFIRMALDSLHPDRVTRGQDFDLTAVDLLLEQRLPCTRQEKESTSIYEARIHRALTELALVVHMIQVECDRSAGGTTLPVFDTVERILCRAVDCARGLETPGRPIQEDLDALIEQYLSAARRLLQKLAPIADLKYGLAIPSRGESINYPLRALRLGGHLAVAGLALLSRAARRSRKKQASRTQAAEDRAEATRIAEFLVTLWDNNPGGFLSPVTDDQIIELGLAWELWLRLGMREPVARSSGELVRRLALRKATGLPLPGLWQRARWPMQTEHIQALVEAHARGREEAPSSFNDQGSTILPLAVYLAQRLGYALEPGLLQAFLPAKAAQASPGQPPRGKSEKAAAERIWTVHPQCWQPPDDAADEWYAHGIERRGTCRVLDITAATFQQDFERFNRPVRATTAERLGVPVVDRMSWKLWRTPPPMALFVELVQSSLAATPANP